MERRDTGQILDDAAPDVADDHLGLKVTKDVESVGDDQEKADCGKKAGDGERPEGRAAVPDQTIAKRVKTLAKVKRANIAWLRWFLRNREMSLGV